MRTLRLVAVLLAGLAVAAPALASEERPTLSELEREVNCPTCKTTLQVSNAPIADRIREYIRGRIAAGDTKSEIKAKLIAQFGEAVLAAPPKKGFNLLVWVLPLAGVVGAGGLLGLLAWRWSRTTRGERDAAAADPTLNGRRALDPELERRLDEELARFDG